jgi:signal transduction histidine kinase
VQTLALLLEKNGAQDPLVTSLVKKMKRQVSAMATLVTDVLDVSRMRLSSIQLHREPADLAEIAQESVERLRPAFDEEGTRLELHAPSAVEGRWDRIRLDQVVTNLLSNALKYGEKRPVQVIVEDGGEVARLSVRDHGPGIPAAERSAIFDRFARPAGQRRSGHGLGLWISRSIVAAHGGTIAVESSPGTGSIFVVELPKVPGSSRLPAGGSLLA